MHCLLEAGAVGATTVQAPSESQAGAAKPAAWPNVPGCQILDRLGQGGMGVVYRAWQERLHRMVAVKMLRAGAGDRPDVLARFRVEGEAIARLQHPNIEQI